MTNKHNEPAQPDDPPPYDPGLPGTSHAEPPPFTAIDEHEHLITAPAYGTEPPNLYLFTDESFPSGHPCVQAGMHDIHTSFGLLGVMAAIFWFPLGIGCCLLDRRTTCRRCGTVLSTGFCD